jgi:site-specific DNA-methyltransferase (cytosine-N4-specific)
MKFLTEPGDLVVDIFSGSNTTGEVSEELGRKWISIELDRSYACLSGVRFMQGWNDESIRAAFADLQRGKALTLHGEKPVVHVPAARSVRARQRLGQRNLFQA